MCDRVPSFRIIRIDSDVFTLSGEGGTICCRARKTLKRRADIRVGDFVRTDDSAEPVITDVLPRRNALIRPAVANVDTVVIVLCPEPAPDFMTVDKLIINCRAAGIRPYVCCNKSDLSSPLFAIVREQYDGFAEGVLETSAAERNLAALQAILPGRLTVLAGQSGVGKSSIVNALTGSARVVGDVSEKIGRGKNTTTRAEIVPLGNDSYIMDTPGFSMLDVHESTPEELADWYGYTSYASACRFGGNCSHTVEPDCAVKARVASGRLNAVRYDRYVKLYRSVRAESRNRR